MARTVDDRVVSASFETSKFEAGTQKMLSSLDKLKKSMDFKDAGKGLDKFNASANRLNLGHISAGIDSLNNKFKALRLVGIATLAGIAQKAVATGASLVKQFTVAPVIQGLHEYENQLNSVQTILANTHDAGTNLKDVNGALDQLNTYADKTIYNFGQMTRNVGTFTAAGVDLKTAVGSIKGIANLAALSGSNAQQASTAMYQLSQAISAGRVSLQDWNSVVNAGMGGAVFQKALMRTAQNMGTLKDSAVQIDKATGKATINGTSFRESIMAKPGEKSWLTGDVLTNTLKQLSGDMTNAQLKAKGFSDAQIKAIQDQAKMALDAATKVKTLHQLLDTVKEAVGSGWAKTWMIVFGDFGEAKKLFTSLSVVIGKFVGESADARNKVLGDWKKLGGRTILIKALKQVFEDLSRVITPIAHAFRNIFPAKTGRDLLNFTKAFYRLTKALEPSRETMRKIQVSFRGFFAVLDIGKQIVGGIFHVLGRLFGSLGDGTGGFLDITAAIGGWLYTLDASLKKSNAIANFFEKLGDILEKPIDFLKKLGHEFATVFSGATIGKASSAMGPLETIIEGVNRAWDKFIESISSAPGIVKPALEGISEMFGGIGKTIAEALKGADFDSVFKVIQAGLITGILLTLRKGLGGGVGNALTGGVLQSLAQALTGFGRLGNAGAGLLGAYTGQLQAMQTKLKSEALRNIAIAVALLSASIIGLSLVDPEKLNGAMTAITIAFGELLGAMAILDKIGSSTGFVKTPVIAASMILLAGAIDILAIAVYALSRLSWEELAKGLGAVTVLLGGLSAAAIPLSANSVGLIRAGAGITVIAVAMNILAQAVKSFGGMDMNTLAKGIGGISVALAGIGAAANLFPTGMVAMGVGLIAIAAALKIMAGTIQTLGSLDMRTLAKGIGSIAVALTAIGLAMRTMPGPSMVITAAGLVLVAAALKGIAKSIALMGGMSIREIAKGLGAMAASLIILTVALHAMSGTLAGSAALAIAAAGIAVLVPALKSLGEQSWGQIVKGIVALAAAFALLGVAGVALAPVAPAILALGVALIAIGAGLALAGAGVALLGIGLASIAVAGPAAVRIMVDAMVQMAEALPKVIANLAKALVQLVDSIGKAAPKFVQALGKIISAMAQAIIVAAPALTKAFVAILELIFTVLRKEFPNLVKTGFEMLKALLKGISNNIGGVVKMVGIIVAKFLGAIASSMSKIIVGGAKILAGILKGIGDGIGKVVTAAANVLTSFLRGISNNIQKVAKAGVDVVTKWLKAIGDEGSRIISSGTTMIIKLAKGVGDAAGRMATAALRIVTRFITTITTQIPKEVDRVASAIIRMLNALAGVIRRREPEFFAAMGNIGSAVVEGILKGLNGLGGKILDKVGDEIKSLPKKGFNLVKKAFGAAALSDNMAALLINNAQLTTELKGFLFTVNKGFLRSMISLGAENIDILFKIGNDLTTSFKNGLLTGFEPTTVVDPIQQALSDMVVTVKNSQSQIEQSTIDSNAKIKELNSTIKQDYRDLGKAIRAKDKQGEQSARNSIKQHKAERDAAEDVIATNKRMITILGGVQTKLLNLDHSLQGDIDKLAGYRKEVERLNGVLEAQVAYLDELKSKRDSLYTQTFDKFSTLPDIVGVDENGNKIDPKKQVENYTGSLATGAEALTKFGASLDRLHDAGLNDDTYKQLLDVGPAAQEFVDTLLNMGPDAINAINAADSNLQTAAKTLAEHGASQMYDASIATWEGFVQGTKDSIKTTTKAAEDLVDVIIKAVKRKLHIKSPSQVMAELGAYSVEGFAQGFSGSSKMVTDAVYGVSDDAKAAIKRSMQGISDIVTDSIDPNPTITPILDLSQIQRGADQMGSILTVPATASLALASGISVDQPGSDPSQTATTAAVQFNQYNSSPEALSSIEIYRQTRNQLSQARDALAS